MYCITSLAHFQLDRLGLLDSSRKQARGLQQAHELSPLVSSWVLHVAPFGVFRAAYTCSNGALRLPVRRARQRPASTLPRHMCVHNDSVNRPRELVLCRDFALTKGTLFGQKGRALGQLGSMRRMRVHTHAFNPQSGGSGGGGPSRVILNLAGAGLLTYLTITGRLDWLFDTILALWLISSVLWWFAERSLIKGPCPNCGGEFQVFEFTLKEEYRLCPYCSQPFKLENKKFVRDGPNFSNQQTRGFNNPFGGFGGFEDLGTSASSRKREDSTGVIVDVEAEVRDKD
ncbi:hypothetical protein GOP47_0014482 [Adiantum capillus-veneris]|uniref:Uncharacterized protein n=1 Tax=Adiantum capillus-veneris TaxID=13818 RepID=A0A9D4UM47_ADICA|nr:hypothetical protein GOP47_0014482 [Adiantum capillus-veneris]